MSEPDKMEQFLYWLQKAKEFNEKNRGNK